MNPFAKSLRFKVTLLVIVVELLIFSGLGVFYTHRFNQEIDNAIIARLSIPALLMTRGELSFDAVSDKRTMEGLLREPYSEGIVIGLDGHVYFSSDPARLETHLDAIDGLKIPGPETSPRSAEAPDLITPVQDSTGTYLTCLSPLRPDGKLTGYLYLKVRTATSEAEKREISILFAIGSLVTIALTVPILSWLLHLMVIRRLNYLVEIFRRFALGDYAARAQPSGGDEIATLMNGFNGLAKRLEDTVVRLSKSETLLNVTQRLTKVGGWEFDVKSGKSFWTEELYRIHEIPNDPGIDHIKESLACYRPEDRQMVSDAFRRACEQGESYDLELPFTTYTGKPLWVRTTAQPVYEEGKVVRLVGNLLDITERKRVEHEIRKLNQELERRVIDRTAQLEVANKELETFAYSVSHDLRAPLRHIDGFLGLLKKHIGSTLDDEGRRYMATISEAALRMADLIDDLLSFSRMGRKEMARTRFDLADLVREVIREFEPETKGRVVHWRVGELPAVTGDRAMLRIALANLISNAIKFTQTRNEANIEIGCQPGKETETTVFVRDNGVGFDMQYAGKLFGVFQRLHGFDEFKGTGIGLANVHQVISRHGGKTWAEGKIDGGATFYFSLPRTEQGNPP